MVVKKQREAANEGTRAKRITDGSAGTDRASRHRMQRVSRTSERIIKEISSRRRRAMKVLANR